MGAAAAQALLSKRASGGRESQSAAGAAMDVCPWTNWWNRCSTSTWEGSTSQRIFMLRAPREYAWCSPTNDTGDTLLREAQEVAASADSLPLLRVRTAGAVGFMVDSVASDATHAEVLHQPLVNLAPKAMSDRATQ